MTVASYHQIPWSLVIVTSGSAKEESIGMLNSLLAVCMYMCSSSSAPYIMPIPTYRCCYWVLFSCMHTSILSCLLHYICGLASKISHS